MVYGLEMMAVTEKLEEMAVAQMKMLRFAMRVTRKDKIRNEYIRDTIKVEQVRNKDEGWHIEVIWTCHEERPGVHRKGDKNGVTGKEENREAQKKIFRCSKGRYGESWCKGE